MNDSQPQKSQKDTEFLCKEENLGTIGAVFRVYKVILNYFNFASFLRFSANSAANVFGGVEIAKRRRVYQNGPPQHLAEIMEMLAGIQS